MGMLTVDAESLILRDEAENDPYGQQLRDTYYLADIFIEMNGNDGEAIDQMARYFQLLFGEKIITPTIDEFGMYFAYSASLRTADLSRQVGAAILSQGREIISIGTNEVPAPLGGQYWEDSTNDNRDFKKGFDSNARIKRDVLREILIAIKEGFNSLPETEKDRILDETEPKLKSTRLMNLTEFGRIVHAEMESILSAVRLGVSVKNCDLYTTTFPCHNCAKHIVGSGIKRVVYIQPYPKSLAQTLHSDSIAFAEDEITEGKVCFQPFVGIGPKLYPTLFSIMTPDGIQLKRKTRTGEVNCEPFGLRISASPLTYIDREAVAALAVKKIGQLIREEEHL